VPPPLPDAEAAKRLGITQPRVSRLIKGKWQDFSLDMLLTRAARAGLKPELRLDSMTLVVCYYSATKICDSASASMIDDAR
jgi:predicted transcriptional regulator